MADDSPKCPVDHSKFTTKPVGHPETAAASSASSAAGLTGLAGFAAKAAEAGAQSPSHASSCPIDHSKFKKSSDTNGSAGDRLNPLNMMPELAQQMASGQKIPLPTERTQSGIPRSDSGETWEYPSPQASPTTTAILCIGRKGKEAPEESIESMVDIHNFLNEACWQEILKWENKYHCDCVNRKLVKFQGRPDELSPKAWFYTTFRGVERPFDRHDWTIDRCGKQVRYVIDYYGAPEDDKGQPVFNVDVRPALDSPTSIVDRARAGLSTLWSNIFG
eukprot:jgi/Hompol1/695/HPOL_002586-RA